MGSRMLIKVTGYDPSLRNWGMASGVYDTETGAIALSSIAVCQPVLHKGKQVRQNSEDLDAANQLAAAAIAYAKGAQAIFVEVPVGSQSSRAMASYGVCVGVLGALRAMGILFIEVTPTEVKMASFGKPTASKKEMIDWAMTKYPSAGWPMQTEKGVTTPIASKAEHMADATAAIEAGIRTNVFKQMLQLMQQN